MKKERDTKRQKLESLIPDPAKRTEVISRLYKGDPLLGDNGIFTGMLQTLINAALEGEMDESLKTKEAGSKNRRNGYVEKNVRSSLGPIQIQTPRDRTGEHEPILVKKWERDLHTGIDDIIISLYARGQSIEDVRSHLKQVYGIEVSSGVISAVTDRVWPEILEWQQRPLQSCYVTIYLDGLFIKVRESGHISTKTVYSCYGINVEGQREILGLYIDETEGARHWGLILEDLKRRGVEDVLFFCVDGLKGLPNAIEQVYPQAIVQRCIVHMIRSSTKFVSSKNMRKVCGDLRNIYTSANLQQAEIALECLAQNWNKKYPEMVSQWKNNWDELMLFMAYGEQIRRMIYTTNPVEALHRVIRKVIKTKGAWCNEKGLIKQIYLALKYNEKSWNQNVYNWSGIQRELLEKFGDRYARHL